MPQPPLFYWAFHIKTVDKGQVALYNGYVGGDGMTIRKLQYFVAVAHYLNFSVAAEKMYISQPTLSRQIAELEDDLGLKLFVRTKRATKLTVQGDALLTQANAVLQQYDILMNTAKQLGQGLSGGLRVGFTSSGISQMDMISRIVRTFSEEFPNIDISLEQGGIRDLLRGLEDGRLDLLWGIESCFSSNGHVILEPIMQNTLKLAVSVNHPLAQRQTVRLDALTDETVYSVEQGSALLVQDYIHQIWTRHKFSPKAWRQCTDMQSLATLVSAGRGVAFYFANDLTAMQKNLHFLSLEGLEDEMQLATVLGWLPDNMNAAIPRFIKLVKSVVRDLTENGEIY